jgi:uncharacterized protein (UPF0297 family)
MFVKNENPTPSADTRTFPSVSDRDATIRQILGVVYEALEDKGYNPVNQIVGYILSEDPAYITNHKNARSLITRFDRDELLDSITRFYFVKQD